MKLKHTAAAAAIIAGVFGIAAAAAPAQAQTYSRLVVFGDSLSDNGNLFAVTAGTNPPSPPYFNGRFSNGTVWTENLGFSLNNITAGPGDLTGNDDWAFGGAVTGVAANPPGIVNQIAMYQGGGGTFGSHDLVTIWGGANDFFNNVAVPACQNQACITGVAITAGSNMGGNIATIANAGAGTILIPNLPDLSTTPAFSTSPAMPLASIYTNVFNGALAANVAGVAAGHPNTNFIEMDVFSAFKYMAANPAMFGFADVTHACLLTPSCASASVATQNTFAFWDTVHPTAHGHQILAELATEYLYYGNLGVPTAAEGEATMRHRGVALDAAAGNLQGRAFQGGSPTVTFAIFGETSQTDARLGGLMPTVKENGGGGAVILDVPEDEHFHWGAQLSGQQSDIKAGLLSFRDLSGGVDLYGGWRGGGGVFVNAVGGASFDQFTDIKRVTMVAPIVNTASTNGWSAGAKLQGGWYFDMGGMALSPRVAINWQHGAVEGYTEQGPMVREAIAQRTINTTSGEATLRLETGTGGSMYAYLEGGYRDYLTYQADPVTVSLPGNTAHPLATDVGKPDKGVGLVNAGINGRLMNAVSVGIVYQGQFSGSYHNNMGGVGVSVKF